ncbi:MAG: glycosyltransferase family 39 protein [Armatimonadetes bacterium]|nr:glycosyltransferase family 39 protein [Armatimonadota bacterium]
MVVGCLLTLSLAPLPHIDGDAALYGKIAKNVVESGEWLTFSFRPGWVVDKPPLTIWLIAASLRVAPGSDAALRVWQLLMSVILVAVTYRLARVSAGREESLLAALLLVTGFQVFYQNLTPQQDVALTLFLTLALFEYVQYRRDGRTGAAVWTGVWAALAVLTKGLVGLAAFGIVAGADVLLAWRSRDPNRRWRWTQVALGGVVFLAVAAPWFVLGYLRQGMPFLETFFLSGNLGIGRFFSPRISVLPPLWQSLLAYIPVLLVGLMPWTGLLPGIVREGWRSLRAGPSSLRLCALWAVLFFLILSASATDKVFRYLHPVYPPLAVLGARVLAGALDAPGRLRLAGALTLLLGLPVLGGGMWWLASRFPQEAQLYLPIVRPFVVTLAASVAVFSALALWRRNRIAVAALAAGAILAYGLAAWGVMQDWERLWPWRTLAATVHRLYQSGDRVVVFKEPLNFPEYFIEAPVALVEDEAALARTWQEGRTFAILRAGDLVRLPEHPPYRVLVDMPAGWVLAFNE